jgi:hypothetical protein
MALNLSTEQEFSGMHLYQPSLPFLLFIATHKDNFFYIYLRKFYHKKE